MSDIKYVAFDVHKATTSVAVLNLDGKLVTQAIIQTQPDAIQDLLRSLGGLGLDHCDYTTNHQSRTASWAM